VAAALDAAERLRDPKESKDSKETRHA